MNGGPAGDPANTPTAIAPGDYSYYFIASGGCSQPLDFTVGQADPITLTGISQTTIDCNGGSATVTITATGGVAPLTYTFDGVSNSTGIFPHIAGTGLAYSITDANNCTAATGTFDVVQPAAITVSNIAQSVIACNGGTATVTFTAAGGTGLLSYTFDGVTNTSRASSHMLRELAWLIV